MSARQRQPGTLMHVNMSTPRLLAHWGMGPCRGQSGGGEPIGEGPSAELLFLRLLCVGVGEASPEVVLPEPRPFFAAFGVRGLRGLVPPELARLESPPDVAMTWSLRPELQGAQQKPKKDLAAGGGRTGTAVAISSLGGGEGVASGGWAALDTRLGSGLDVPALSALGSAEAAAKCDACSARETAAASGSAVGAEALEVPEEREPGSMPESAPVVKAKKPT